MKQCDKKYFIIKVCILVISLCALFGCSKNERVKKVADETNNVTTDNQKASVQVDNVKDFLESIAPGTTIILAPGYYNLSEYTEEIWKEEGEAWNQTHPYVQLRECYDGGIEVVVCNVNELFVTGDLESEIVTELVVETRYGAVLNFKDCSNIELNGLTMGHTQEGACDESVITFSNCTDVHLSAMDLYGCGMYGFTANSGSGNVYVQSCTIRDCEGGPFYITEPAGKYEFRNCWLNGSSGGGYYEPAQESELIFEECNFGTCETNYWYFNEDAVLIDCYWEEVTEYPDVEPKEIPDFDSLIPVNSNEVDIADTYYAYVVVNQQSGDAVYHPDIELQLSEDGTGYYETEGEHFDITWNCETDGTIVLESEIYRYLELYLEHQDGFDILWIMMQMDEEIVWLN